MSTCISILFRNVILFLLISNVVIAQTKQKLKADSKQELILQKGFISITVVPKSGRARHIAVDKYGNVYVKLRTLDNGKGIVFLQDTTGDGKADIIKQYGNYGGTGMAIYNNFLYSSSDSSVYRYSLTATGIDEAKMILL
jgi:hypothetical protein